MLNVDECFSKKRNNRLLLLLPLLLLYCLLMTRYIFYILKVKCFNTDTVYVIIKIMTRTRVNRLKTPYLFITHDEKEAHDTCSVQGQKSY